MIPTEILDLSAIDVMHVVPVAVAFLLGLAARAVGLPPLVGFLAAGFALGAFGFSDGPVLREVADLGVTLLLFTIGLKLKVRDLVTPVVWVTAGAHMAAIVAVAAALVLLLAWLGSGVFAEADLGVALLTGFALSFSSTVFAVKAFEERGELSSLHGRVAIGILIMQDIFAVVFIALSTGKIPSPWALLLFGLLPLRPLLFRVIDRAGHGELLVLLGWLLPLAGAALFEAVGVKADLGALILGILLAGHPKANELVKNLLSFKDLFLIGFFLTIGLGGGLSVDIALTAVLLVLLLVPLKVALYFLLMVGQRMRARSATMASLGLASFSEFGLIVGSVGASNGWLGNGWLSGFALALALSFILASPLNVLSRQIYERFNRPLRRWQHRKRLPGDELINPGEAQVIVFGMGRVGTGAYNFLRKNWGDVVLGVDLDPAKIRDHRTAGRNVLLGDATDPDFWARAERKGHLQLALLAFPDHRANLSVARLLRQHGYDVRLASVAHYPDQAESLRAAGVEAVFNFYGEAGAGFAEHVVDSIGRDLGIDQTRNLS